jgi:hypothetical protein
MTTTLTRTDIAYHEAGHAVAYWAVGIHVCGVGVDEHERDGFVMVPGRWRRSTTPAADAICCLSGYAAELRLGRISGANSLATIITPSHDLFMSIIETADGHDVMDLLSDYFFNRLDALRFASKMGRWATELVATGRAWGAIGSLAHQLLAGNGVMQGSVAQDVIATAWGPVDRTEAPVLDLAKEWGKRGILPLRRKPHRTPTLMNSAR